MMFLGGSEEKQVVISSSWTSKAAPRQSAAALVTNTLPDTALLAPTTAHCPLGAALSAPLANDLLFPPPQDPRTRVSVFVAT